MCQRLSWPLKAIWPRTAKSVSESYYEPGSPTWKLLPRLVSRNQNIHPPSEKGHPKSPINVLWCRGLDLATSYVLVTDARNNPLFSLSVSTSSETMHGSEGEGVICPILNRSSDYYLMRSWNLWDFKFIICIWNVCFKRGPLFLVFHPRGVGPAKVPCFQGAILHLEVFSFPAPVPWLLVSGNLFFWFLCNFKFRNLLFNGTLII